MIYSCGQNYDIPNVDLLTLLFDTPPPLCKSTEETPLHIEADNPTIAITKRHARNLTKKLAHTFRHRYGIGAQGPGKDAVVVVSSGQAMLPIVFYGVVAAGGVYSAASTAFGVAELSRQISEGEAKLVICTRDTQIVAVAAAHACGVEGARVLVVQSAPDLKVSEMVGGRDCLGEEELEWERVTSKAQLEELVICLLYSSGTTGVPKGSFIHEQAVFRTKISILGVQTANFSGGVLLTHMNILSAVCVSITQDEEYFHGPRAARGEPPFEYRTIGHLPVSHIAGVQGYFVNAICHGGPVYWMPKFDFAKFLDYNEKYRITSFFSVPPIYLLIAKSPSVTNQFASLERCITGAAPMGKELQLSVASKLGNGNVVPAQTWGLSETTGSSTLMPWGEVDLTGSVSKPLPNVMIRIINEAGQDMAPGVPGEILIKGPMVCKGYFKNPNASRELFLDDYCRTGDVGYVKNGLLYVVDRMKELIKYKGTQVAPAELEALLMSHPLIADAAVIGVEGESTELPRAYVVANEERISADEIRKFVKDNLASYKQLRGGVVFISAIPKSPAGKILRKDLRLLSKRGTTAKL